MNNEELDIQIQRAMAAAADGVPIRDRLAELAGGTKQLSVRFRWFTAHPALAAVAAFAVGLVLVGGGLAVLRSGTDNPTATVPPASDPPATLVTTTTVEPVVTTSTTTTTTTTTTLVAPGPELEVRTPVGLPGDPLVICGDARTSTEVRVVLSDIGSGDSWPDEIDEFVTTEASGKWCWRGVFPDQLQLDDRAETPNYRPITPGSYEIRLESFGNVLGYDSVEILPGYSTDDGPSQSAADAARDGVLGAVAELPLSDRVATLLWKEAPEGLWVLSRPGEYDEWVFGGECEPDDDECVYGRDFIAMPEYSELLLMDPTGTQILRAYPMPSLVPSWLVVGHDAVYTGRIGDGGMPDSSVARIDRETLELSAMVFANELDGPSQIVNAIRADEWLDGWSVYEGTGPDPQVVTMAGNTFAGVKAPSWIGDVWVDLAGIDALVGGS